MPALPQNYLDSVVAIERLDGLNDNAEEKYALIGSGVLVSMPVPDGWEDDPEAVDSRFVFLATNWHVIEGHEEVFAKMNAGGAAQRFPLSAEDDEGDPLWYSFGDFDIAVTCLRAGKLRSEEAEFVAIPQENWLTLEQMEAEDLGPSDPVSVCGFPMGLSGTLKKHAIVRGGTIARVDDELLAQDSSYLLDCLIFPGNSGGPAFDKPISKDRDPSLIGIVSGYLPYQDVAVSAQTGRPRVTFEENSGLAAVVPVDAIMGACQACLAFSGELTGPQEESTSRRTAARQQVMARPLPGPVESA